MRKQYHFWPRPGGLDAWDVDRLIDLTFELPVEEVALDDLSEIDSVYWFDESEVPTVRKVVDHLRLIRDVDTSHPIILGLANRVMDGMHRIARAMLEGRATIRAVRLIELPEPDFRGCRADQLPYWSGLASGAPPIAGCGDRLARMFDDPCNLTGVDTV